MKPIKLTSYTNEIVAAFTEYLSKHNACSNHFNFNYNVSDLFKTMYKDTPTPKISITSTAYLKMMKLVNNYNSEVAWHGVVDRTEDEYLIHDILVYPQTVTGTTVVSDDEAYGPWIQGFDDDTFFNIRMQGHSHVNFSTSASSTDMTYYETLLTDIDDYYIFIIINKKEEINVMLYDVANNLIFETEDIDFDVVDEEGNSLDLWLLESEETISTTKLGRGTTITQVLEGYQYDYEDYDTPHQHYKGYNTNPPKTHKGITGYTKGWKR